MKQPIRRLESDSLIINHDSHHEMIHAHVFQVNLGTNHTKVFHHINLLY